MSNPNAPKKVFQPLHFACDGKKALIQIEDGLVEIHGRDLSRLWFVMSQVMDKADLMISQSDSELRLEDTGHCAVGLCFLAVCGFVFACVVGAFYELAVGNHSSEELITGLVCGFVLACVIGMAR